MVVLQSKIQCYEQDTLMWSRALSQCSSHCLGVNTYIANMGGNWTPNPVSVAMANQDTSLHFHWPHPLLPWCWCCCSTPLLVGMATQPSRSCRRTSTSWPAIWTGLASPSWTTACTPWGCCSPGSTTTLCSESWRSDILHQEVYIYIYIYIPPCTKGDGGQIYCTKKYRNIAILHMY